MADEKMKSCKDATPRELAEKIVQVLYEKGAQNIKLVYVEKQTIIADYYVIVTGSSNTQIRALADAVEFELTEAECPPKNIEGHGTGSWVLLDFSSVAVHVFSREARDFYKLEKLWSDAEEIDISEITKKDK